MHTFNTYNIFRIITSGFIVLYEMENTEYANFFQNSEKNYEKSGHFLMSSRKFNCVSSFVITTIGLISNLLAIFIFLQKKFRTNSSHIFLFCVTVNDSFFLIFHSIEVSKNKFNI